MAVVSDAKDSNDMTILLPVGVAGERRCVPAGGPDPHSVYRKDRPVANGRGRMSSSARASL